MKTWGLLKIVHTFSNHLCLKNINNLIFFWWNLKAYIITYLSKGININSYSFLFFTILPSREFFKWNFHSILIYIIFHNLFSRNLQLGKKIHSSNNPSKDTPHCNKNWEPKHILYKSWEFLKYFIWFNSFLVNRKNWY